MGSKLPASLTGGGIWNNSFNHDQSHRFQNKEDKGGHRCGEADGILSGGVEM